LADKVFKPTTTFKIRTGPTIVVFGGWEGSRC